MKIAIQAADLDHARIDGTRVYILNMLKYFGEIDTESQFFIYHKSAFNPRLTPKSFPNYTIKQKSFPLHWTQTRFAQQILQDQPDRLWMPMHSLPALRSKRIKTIVTIHDLAFKIFPTHFARKDLYKINLLTDYAAAHADRFITVSQSAKEDLLQFYPKLSDERVHVVPHGLDATLFSHVSDITADGVTLQSLTVEKDSYLLYAGAIQPRKNIITLVKAFERAKRSHSSLKLVIAGERAWLHAETENYITHSKYYKDIILTGAVSFETLAILYRNAVTFVFPSLYEGFGIPILEAFASGTPVICANNSSLPEVAGDAALYFDAMNDEDLGQKINSILDNVSLQKRLRTAGIKRAQSFSWKKSARQTLEVIKKS